ncbi:hypothetical protein [Pyrococcus abyssi]|uniref:Uncharacterized protein n=1 Tax=Pyrococcus abyssi (strain GE5 / Orsay) TaxID=272844 RepID=Q9UYM3_PYRAB|nr:hypothetical protein [Pyrococcus abyssi]CAB50389.1 Hypothetical protein PAB0985 [Pyrococcus abyssi GE5]CCE70936.1 TPA: hypothetical protein PAB0985 [Pyrococcus abyssi GE5]
MIKDNRLSYAFLGLFALFLLLSLASYSRPTSFSRQVIEGSIVEEGMLKHEGHLMNSTIYGEFASLGYYPTKITDYIVGDYRYRVTPKEDGNYTLKGLVSYYVTKGKGKVYLINETMFSYKGKLTNGMFEEKFTVNLSKINKRRSEISEALNLPRLSYEIKVVADIDRENGTFSQEMPVINDAASGLTYIDNTNIKKRNALTKTVKEELKFLGMRVSTARIVFPILAFISGVVALLAWEPRKRKWAIEARPTGIGERVIVNDMKSLKKIAGIVGSPIIHYETDGISVYGVIDGHVLYEYWEIRSEP